MNDIEGFILAGGASSRMGEDKSRLRLGGRTFVERIADALRTVTARVRLVSSRPDAGSHGLPVLRDEHEGRVRLVVVGEIVKIRQLKERSEIAHRVATTEHHDDAANGI